MIVTANCRANVAVMGYQVVSRVEPHPPQMGHERLNPRVRGVWRGAIVVFTAAVKVP